MAFRSWDNKHIARFNSSVSSEFLNFYETKVDEILKEDASRPSHRTFAASSFRCNRKSWFRLRGVTPDVPEKLDATLKFTADVGTACHRIIQTNLRRILKTDFIDVSGYLESLRASGTISGYDWKSDDSGCETQVEISDPPIRFACDGIVRWNDDLYLLEIKTAEFDSWNSLTDPKEEHIDQVKCYATLLHLNGVLFLYQDRQYGGLKCYEIKVTESEKQDILDRFRYVMDMVNKNLAPDALPKGDNWCTPTRCPYYKKCGEYGR